MNRRDIELLISARDTTGRTFKQVTDNIASLNRAIDEQVLAAQRGEGSLDELRRAQQALAQAGRDLSGLQGQIDAYEKLAANQTKAGAAADKAKADLAALSAEIAKAEKATTAQENKLQRLEVAVVKTGAAYEKNKTDLTAQVAVLERAGIATDSLGTAQVAIVNSAREIGAGLVQANAAIDGFAINLQQAANAEKNLAAQRGFDNKLAQAQQLGQAAAFVRLFADATQTVAVAENQLEALNGFRAVGAQAAEASRDVNQFVVAGKAMGVSSQEVANGLRQILQPGAEAIRTLDGLEASIAAASAIANAEKASVAEYSNALNDLAAQAAAITRQGSLVDTFKNQEAAVASAKGEFRAAQLEVEKLGKAMAAADTPTEALSNDLKTAQLRLVETGRALGAEETKLLELSRALKAAKIDSNNLTDAQNRLKAAATQVAGSMDNANKVLGRGGQKASGLFGLNPYEIQNLGYQINDVVVSLISGQKPLTVFFQQGLQISQLFPGMISNIAAFVVANGALIGVLAGVGAALVVVGQGVSNYYEDLQRVKDFQLILNELGNAGGNSAQGLADISERLQNIGLSADEAKDTMKAFVAEGLDPARIEEYSKAAKDLSERLGVDLAEATSLLTDIQTGGMEAVIELTSKTHDLTEAELDHAQALFDAGKAAEARQYILDRVADKQAEIAAATNSMWTPAVNNLKSAWSSFTNFLSAVFAPVLDTIQQKVNNLAVGLAYVTALLAGKGFKGAETDAAAVINRQRGKLPAGGGATNQQIRDREYRADLDREYRNSKLLTAEERRRNAVVDARRKAQSAGVSKSVEDLAATRALAKVNAEISKEQEAAAKKEAAAAKRGQSAKDKAERQAESLANRQRNAQQQLQQQLGQLDSAEGRGKSASLEDRLRIVDNSYQKIFFTLEKLRSLGITESSDGQSLAAITAQVNAAKERLKSETAIKFNQDQIGLLEKQRADEVARVQDAQERGALTVQQAYEQTAEINARLSPQIVTAARSALEIAKQIAGATPSPEMVSLMASLERIIASEPTNNIAAKLGLDTFDTQQNRLNDLIKDRDDLVAAYLELRDLGINSDAQTRKLTAEAYKQQAASIAPVLESLRQSVEYLHQTKDALTGLPLLSDAAYAAWQAKLTALNAGLKESKTSLSAIESEAINGIANGVAGAFTTATGSLAGLIAGTKSWGDVFADIGTSILQSLADITLAIGQAIIKFLLLKAIESAIGLPSGSLSGGGGGGLFGLFHGGGVVGQGGGSIRRGNMGSWIGAPKFHGGGGLGLKPDEYKAVLKRGEEVLTEDNPRHVNNVGNDNAQNDNTGGFKQVLLLDPEAVPSAMVSRSGQKSILTVIRQNKETIKQMIS